jgi:hypothetical protein
MSVIASSLLVASPPPLIEKAKSLLGRVNKLRALGPRSGHRKCVLSSHRDPPSITYPDRILSAQKDAKTPDFPLERRFVLAQIALQSVLLAAFQGI